MALMLSRRQTECKQVYLELPRCEPTNEARVETKFTLILPSKEEETQVVRRKRLRSRINVERSDYDYDYRKCTLLTKNTYMIKRIAQVAMASLMWVAVAGPAKAQDNKTVYVIDKKVTHQVIDNFGASDAWRCDFIGK